MNRSVLAVVAAAALGTQAGRLPQAPAPRPADAGPARKLLFPARERDVPDVLRAHVAALLSPTQQPVDPAAAKPGGVFLRVVSRRNVLAGRAPGAGMWVGARPFVFLTVPETAYGRTLVQLFGAIGYDPADVLTAEFDVEKVAVVFTYPDAADPNWDRRVYPATWDNLFDLAGRLAADPARCAVGAAGFEPERLRLRTEAERALLAGFQGDRERVKADFAALRQAGGAEWEYRAALARALGASEHYRGDGRTKLTYPSDGPGRAGFPEFLGPNARLTDLPAVAVVGLGTLRVAPP